MLFSCCCSLFFGLGGEIEDRNTRIKFYVYKFIYLTLNNFKQICATQSVAVTLKFDGPNLGLRSAKNSTTDSHALFPAFAKEMNKVSQIGQILEFGFFAGSSNRGSA